MKRFVFGKVMGVGSFSIIATFLLLSVLNIDSWAYDRTVYDLEINNPILNDGNNNDGWINNDEDFYYTDASNSDAKASWTFPECGKSGDYRVLIEVPQSDNHSSGSVSYRIYKNNQSLKDCTVDQSLFYGYGSLGNSANTHHLFYLEKGDIIKIEFATDEANVAVGKAMLSYIEDFSLPIDRYSQTDKRWRCKNLYGASSESDANCTGDPIPSSCTYHTYDDTGPMACWGCLTCAFTSALSYYGVCEVKINGEMKPINPRRIAATINGNNGYNSGHYIIWPPAFSAMEILREGIEFGPLGPDNRAKSVNEDNSTAVWYEIERNVKKGYPVVIQTYNGKHWVLIKGIHVLSENDVTFYICDSENWNYSTLKDFNNVILRYNVVTGPTLPKLARIEGQDPVYWLQNGKAYHVLSFQIIDAMSDLAGWDRNKIDVCPADVLEIRPLGTLPVEDTFEQGSDFIIASPDSDGLLIKLSSDFKVYLIENGERRWITTGDVFIGLGYDRDDIITVTPAILALIPEGDPLYFATRTMNFEDGVDRQPIQSKIPGMVFTTTDGYDWIYGDWRIGYNGPYPDGALINDNYFFPVTTIKIPVFIFL